MKLATDIGGTFTDLAYLDEANGVCFLAKSLSTPPRFSQGIMDAIRKSGLDPAERDTAAARADLRAGSVRPETARDVCGLTSEKA